MGPGSRRDGRLGTGPGRRGLRRSQLLPPLGAELGQLPSGGDCGGQPPGGGPAAGSWSINYAGSPQKPCRSANWEQRIRAVRRPTAATAACPAAPTPRRPPQDCYAGPDATCRPGRLTRPPVQPLDHQPRPRHHGVASCLLAEASTTGPHLHPPAIGNQIPAPPPTASPWPAQATTSTSSSKTSTTWRPAQPAADLPGVGCHCHQTVGRAATARHWHQVDSNDPTELRRSRYAYSSDCIRRQRSGRRLW